MIINRKKEPVDIVITWVNGSDPHHIEKREKELKKSGKVANIAQKARRFSDNGEIYFCLKSIANHMPWVNKVYIVTDNQTPECVAEQHPELQCILNKIQIVDHSIIYADYEHLLPVFNSLALETFLWRIPGLAENFIYFNDDVFLCNRIKEDTFFKLNKVQLRGEFTQWEHPKLSFHAANNRFSAELLGYTGKEYFRAAHICHPLKKSVFQQLFEQHQDLFIKNASYKFRNRKQFWPIGLHNHQALASNYAELVKNKKDWLHFSVAFCRDATAKQIKRKLNRLTMPHVKVACLNYTEAVVEKVPWAMRKLEKVTTTSKINKILYKLQEMIR